MYWNECFACLSTLYFAKVMSRNIYQLISQFLHCSDNTRPEAQCDSERYDPLHKFRLVLDELNDACKRYFVPRQLISIDESLTGLKNRTELIQYIPNEHHHKWGVKLYAMTDSGTGYPLHTSVYCGKKRLGPSSQLGHPYDVVKDLLTKAGLLNKGYHLFGKETLLTGTMRSNRKVVSTLLKKAMNSITLAKDPFLLFPGGKKKRRRTLV